MSEARIGLVEQFYSVQGEGRNAGRPAVFVRFAGCNLSCVFADGSICDTPWRETREKKTVDEIMEWAVDAITEDLSDSEATKFSFINMEHGKECAPMMIFTGGEPTMQPKFAECVREANDLGFYTAVESNGTIYKDVFEELDWFVCSPKNRDIDHPGALADSPDPHEDVLSMPPDEYRYVITGPDDGLPPYREAKRHYLSPAIISDGSGTMHYDGFPGFAPGAAERCIELVQKDPRWRISLQTHKFLGVR